MVRIASWYARCSVEEHIAHLYNAAVRLKHQCGTIIPCVALSFRPFERLCIAQFNPLSYHEPFDYADNDALVCNRETRCQMHNHWQFLVKLLHTVPALPFQDLAWATRH